MGDAPARRMWPLLEAVHAVTYFAPEARAAADAVGMRGFWMGYVAQRAAPLGAVGPEAVAAAFFGFHPARIARALPDAWEHATPDAVLGARLAGVDATLRRVWGEALVASPEAEEAADLAWVTAEGADVPGRVLAAANRALSRPEAPHLALWQAATTLREHRGDGHVAVLVARGLDPVRAHLLKAAAGETDGGVLQASRQWDDEAWTAGRRLLVGDGVLDDSGALTDEGRALHDEVEAATDRAAALPWAALGPERTDRLRELLAPWAAAVIDGGVVPVPNPMGMLPGR